MIFNKKMLLIGLSALGATLVTIPLAIGLSQCSKYINNDNSQLPTTWNQEPYTASSYYEKIIESKPRVANNQYYSTKLQSDANFKYPGYDYNYKDFPDKKQELRRKVLDERTDFVVDANQTNDKNKFAKYSDSRFIRDEIKNKRLKKHPAAKNLYLKNVTDSTPTVTKEFSFNTANWGYSSLGLYAPAGEVVKITFDEETYNLIKARNWNEIHIAINNNYWDCKEPNDDGGSVAKRYPFLMSSFRVNVNEIDPVTRSYEFGTPFGGAISLRLGNRLLEQNQLGLKKTETINFKIEGAVEQLHYAHGVTTKENWEDQVRRVKNNQITAPMLSMNSNYFSFNMQFYDEPNAKYLGENKKVTIDDVVYPKPTMDRWNDFLFISLYAHRNDETGSFPKCNFQFAEELWGSGAAWGGPVGGNSLYAPPSWGVGSFLTGVNSIKAANWGMIHETNHNYQVNEALFERRTHGETNQLNMVNLAILNDESRLRNPKDIGEGRTIENAGGSIYTNPYTTIEQVRRVYNEFKDSGEEIVHSRTEEYMIYSMLIHKLGPYNYLNYIRWDQVNHPNTMSNWNGFEEIRALSEFFKVNFFEAFFDYSKNWNEKAGKAWPKSYNDATAEQKSIVDQYRKYAAFDFVGNMYSVGTYSYDTEKNSFTYNGDYAPAYEIPAGKPYTFNFDEFINSPNLNFTWDDLKIESSSKTGATISIDKTNRKRLIYTPNPNNMDQIDEFTISIRQTNNTNGVKYQPKYMWKIKVRQNAKGMLYSYYDDFQDQTNTNYDHLFNVEWPKIEDEARYNWVGDGKAEINLLDTKKIQPTRTWFNFIAPEDGEYLIQARWDDFFGFWVNDVKQDIDRQNTDQQSMKDIYTFKLKKGEKINLKFVVINTGGNGHSQFNIFKKNANSNQLIDLSENTTIPNIDQLPISSSDVLTNPKYQYVTRRLDYSKLINLSNEWINESEYTTKFPIIPSTDYNFSYDKKALGNINDDNGGPDDFSRINLVLKDNEKREKYIEWWNHGATSPFKFTYDATFSKPTKISSIFFSNPKKAWWGSTYPETLSIIGYSSKYPNGKEIYNNKYGDRNADFVTHNIPTDEYTKLSLSFGVPLRQYKGITLGSVSFLSTPYESIQTALSYNLTEKRIKKSGSWKKLDNNIDQNLSSVGYQYLFSNKANNSLEFNLSNTHGFRLIGQKTIESGLFDVYVNDKLIKTVDTKSETGKKMYNKNLFEYWTPEKQKNIKVRIVHKNSNPLYLNYISPFARSSKFI